MSRTQNWPWQQSFQISMHSQFHWRGHWALHSEWIMGWLWYCLWCHCNQYGSCLWRISESKIFTSPSPMISNMPTYMSSLLLTYFIKSSREHLKTTWWCGCTIIYMWCTQRAGPTRSSMTLTNVSPASNQTKEKLNASEEVVNDLNVIAEVKLPSTICKFNLLTLAFLSPSSHC